ncbi:MAG TPA: hypothetical protein IAB25_06685 [Candidatus Coproplasma stercoravium]|nr:hypothetical protein [Candidatus Coproplasma stercoravium]
MDAIGALRNNRYSVASLLTPLASSSKSQRTDFCLFFGFLTACLSLEMARSGFGAQAASPAVGSLWETAVYGIAR